MSRGFEVFFLPHVANEILSIPLSITLVGNARFWKFDPKGKFTVCGGYCVGIGMYEPNKHQFNNFFVQNWWNILRSLPIPPNIRVFWWKIFHNLIPAASNLANHHVPVSRWCYFCHNSEESTCHSLFYCPAVRHLWKDNVVWRQIKNKKKM